MNLTTAPTAAPLVALLRRHGGRTALVQDSSALSYAALADRVEQARRALGDVRRLVLLIGAHDTGTVAAYLGALAGGHPVLLVPGEDDQHVQGWIASYDPDVVVYPGGELTERRIGTVHELHPDLALLLTTSGSTGSPKLVRLSRQNLLANAEAIAAVLEIGPDDRAVTTLPMAYCYGLSVLHSHLLRGACVVLTELSVLDECFWELCRVQRVTSLAGVPYTYQLLDRVDFLDRDLPDLRCLTQAGGRMPPEQVRRHARSGRHLHVMYGQTEATARMAHLPPHLADTRPEAVGVVIPGGELRVDPANDELVYRGPNVMLGYAESPAELALGRTVHELRTGDLARIAPDGLVEIVGRCARFAKLFGLRVDLEQVERGLAARGTTAWCTATGDGLQVLVEGCQDPAEIEHVATGLTGLPGHAVHIIGVEALPRQGSGKVDAAAARTLLASPPADTSRASTARAVLAQVLDRPVTDSDTFVGLGGDSLSYIEVSLRLEQLLGTLPANWHTTPVGQLARAADTPAPSRLDTSTLLRAIGIVLVLASHVHLSPLLGGAHAMLAVAGYNLARFRLAANDRPRPAAGLWVSARRIAVPTILVIALASAVTPGLGLTQMLLVNNVFGPDVLGPPWRYWFVEILVQLLVLVAVLLHVPVLVRAERAWPFAFALGVLAVGLLPRLGAIELGPGPDVSQSAAGALWIFALGWCAARATSPARAALVALLAVLLLPTTFPTLEQGLVVTAGLLLLLRPSVPLPAALRALRPVLATLAGASLWIYLVHWQVLDLIPPGIAPLELTLCLAAGIGCWRASRALSGTLHPAGKRLFAQAGRSRRPIGGRSRASA